MSSPTSGPRALKAPPREIGSCSKPRILTKALDHRVQPHNLIHAEFAGDVHGFAITARIRRYERERTTVQQGDQCIERVPVLSQPWSAMTLVGPSP
jgi:hypothetical protein